MELNRYLLASHIPTGRLWESCFLSNTNLGTLIKALSLEFYRMTLRADTFINEIDINKTEQLITEWEKSVGIPNDYFLNTASLSMRRIQIELILGNFGGVQLAEDFVRVAALLGYEITVSAPGNPELLINGNMELGDPPAYWVPVSTTTLSSVADERTGGSGTQSMNLVKPFHGVCALQNINTQVGILYKVNGWLKNIDASYITIIKQDLDSENDVWGTDISATSWTEDFFFFQATEELSQIVLFMGGSEGEEARADDLSVQEVLQGNGIEILLNGDMEDGGGLGTELLDNGDMEDGGDLGSEILDNGDMELGGGLGSEILLNGNMESGNPPSNWLPGVGSTLSRVSDERTGGSGTYSMNINRGTSSLAAAQNITAVIGEWYEVRGWLKNIDATSLNLRIDQTTDVISSIVTSTSWTEVSFYFQADLTSVNVYLQVSGSSGEEGRFDDISVKQVQDFDDWTPAGDALLTATADERTGGSGSQSMNAERGTSDVVVIQAFTTVIGDWYEARGWLKNIDASYVQFKIVGVTQVYGTAITSTSWTEDSFYFQATATSTNVEFRATGSTGEEGRFDDFSVKQVQDFDDWTSYGDSLLYAVADERTGGFGTQSMNAVRGSSVLVVYQNITTVIGNWYRVKGWLKNIDATSLTLRIDQIVDVYSESVTSTSWTEVSFYFQADKTTVGAYLHVDGSTDEQGRIDDFSVKEVQDFDDWTAFNDSMLIAVDDERTGGSGTQCMEASRGSNRTVANQAITLVVDNWYEAKGWIKNIDAESVQLRKFDAGTVKESIIVTATEWTEVSFFFQAETTTIYIDAVINGDEGEQGRFDDFSVRQVLPSNNILINGDFEDAGSWDTINGSTLQRVADERTGGSGTWSLEAERGTAAGCASQTLNTALGGKYEASGWLKNIDATSAQLAIIGSTTTVSTAVTSTSWTYVSFEFITNTSTVEIQTLVNGITGEECRFDDLAVVLIESGGSHQIFIDVETDIEGDVFPFTFPFTFSSGGLTYLQTIFDMLAPANVEVIVT